MRVLDIEPAGFQTLENMVSMVRLPIWARRASSERQKETKICGSDFPVLFMIDNGAGQIAGFTTDTVDAVQYAFLAMFEFGEEVRTPYLFAGSWFFLPEDVANADMVLNSVQDFEAF